MFKIEANVDWISCNYRCSLTEPCESKRKCISKSRSSNCFRCVQWITFLVSFMTQSSASRNRNDDNILANSLLSVVLPPWSTLQVTPWCVLLMMATHVFGVSASCYSKIMPNTLFKAFQKQRNLCKVVNSIPVIVQWRFSDLYNICPF